MPAFIKEFSGMSKDQYYKYFYIKIELLYAPEIIPYFYSIFQKGFLFPCRVEKSIDDLLLNQLALEPEFVEKKVSTVFLDGCCVDDISSALLKEGSTVAFSSALPGLAGATLRRGGHYACLRESITHKKQTASEAEHEGLVTVKLFNILMAEMGEPFLEKGIILDGAAARDLFNPRHKALLNFIKNIEIRGKGVSCEEFFQEKLLSSYDQIMIRVVRNTGSASCGRCSDCNEMTKEQAPCV